MVELEIPIKAMSVNACWQGRRFKTKAYSEWRESFFYLCPRTPTIRATSVTIKFYISNFKRADLDNLAKSTIDSLKERGIIEDDRFIKELNLRKFEVKKGEEKIEISLC